MSFSGGVFSINTTGQPVVAATTISASVFNAFTADIATGLSTCILKDGTQTATASVPFTAGLTAGAGAFVVDSSGNIAITTNKFTVAASSGNTAIAGTLAATSNSSIGPGGGSSSTALLFNTTCTGVSGTTQQGIEMDLTGTSAATGAILAFRGRVTTAAAAFTCTDVIQFYADNVSKGAGSTITNQYGFQCTDQTQGGTLNVGYSGAVSAGSGKYNLYMSGTAVNYLEGATRIGADSTNNGINDASTGAGTTTLYIGNAAITVASDVRLKENIVDTKRDALAIMDQLRVVDHTWNDPSDQCENNRNARGTWMGLIAQEADKHIPWIVNRPRGDGEE